MEKSVEKRVMEIIVEQLKIDPEVVTLEAHFIDDLGYFCLLLHGQQ